MPSNKKPTTLLCCSKLPLMQSNFFSASFFWASVKTTNGMVAVEVRFGVIVEGGAKLLEPITAPASSSLHLKSSPYRP